MKILLSLIVARGLCAAAHPALNGTDLEFIENISRRSFIYFSEQTDARTGLTLDRRVYDEGMIHGDPHLGNVIVGTDTKGRYKQYLPKGYGNAGAAREPQATD